MRLQTIDIRTDGSEAEMLESKLSGAGTNFATGAGVGAPIGRIEPATNVARGTRILGIETISRAVKPASRGGDGGS
jgi:hypothetical protein